MHWYCISNVLKVNIVYQSNGIFIAIFLVNDLNNTLNLKTSKSVMRIFYFYTPLLILRPSFSPRRLTADRRFTFPLKKCIFPLKRMKTVCVMGLSWWNAMGRRTENDQCEKKIIYKSITRMGIFFQKFLDWLKVMIPYANVLSYK